MNYLEIDWPLNPTSGQVYTSPFGRTWVWNGCGWEATCCPPASCDPLVDGITLAFFVDVEPGGNYFIGGKQILNLYFLNYVDDVNGYPHFESPPLQPPGKENLYLSIVANYGLWEIYAIDVTDPSNYFLLATSPIEGDYPIGDFTASGISPIDLPITTYCGQSYKKICLSIFDYGKGETMYQYLYPILEDSIDGNLLGYVYLDAGKVAIYADTNQWIFYSNDTNELIGILDGVSPPAYPEGNWSNDLGLIVTTSENCDLPCSYYDGLDLTLTFSDSGGIYFNLAFNYEGDDINGNPIFKFKVTSSIEFSIEYNNSISKWELFISGSPIAYSAELYGSYGSEWFEYSPSNLEYLTTSCGSTFPTLCMNTVDSEANEYSFNLFAAGYSPGEVSIFVPIEGDPIMWNGSQWEGALGPGGTITITLTGSPSVLPIGSWTISDPYMTYTSVETSLGPCTLL